VPELIKLRKRQKRFRKWNAKIKKKAHQRFSPKENANKVFLYKQV